MKEYTLHSKTASTLNESASHRHREAAHSARVGARTELLYTVLGLLAIYLATWLLRAIFLTRSFDIFYDELIYQHISQNVAQGLGIKYYTVPFYLHPPVFFLLEGAYLRQVSPAGNLIDYVYATRYFNLIFAALSAVLLFLIGRRVAGAWAGAFAAGLFALDPFIIRINSRNLLETVAMFWVLLGYTFLLRAVGPAAEMAGGALPAAQTGMQPDRMRKLRLKAGLSHSDLAQRTGLPARLIAQIELGQRTPQASEMRRIATALDLALSERDAGRGDIPDAAASGMPLKGNPYETRQLPQITQPLTVPLVQQDDGHRAAAYHDSWLEEALAQAPFAAMFSGTTQARAGTPAAPVLPKHARSAWVAILGAGCAFGLALLTKEPTAVLLLLPLAICYVLNWSLPRRVSALVAGIAGLVYLIYPLSVALFGDWRQFENQKLSGILRFAGVIQESGFNQHGGPSFKQAIISNLSQFATTYILLGLGIIAIIALIWLGGPKSRLLAAWTASAYALKGFLTLFGTNEEQYFYYLVTSAILASAAAAILVLQSPRLAQPVQKSFRAAAGVAIALFLCWNSYIWVQRHFTADNGYERLFAYLQHNVPAGSRIATTTNASRELLKQSDYAIGSWGTVEAVQENRAQYALISTLLIEKRYDAATPELYEWLVAHAQPVFVFDGPSNGLLVLYRITN